MTDAATENPENFGVGDEDAVLIALLLQGKTNRAAAKATNISESTVHRRLQDPTFRKALSNARSAVLAGVVNALANASDKAVDTLVELLDPKAVDTARLGAARAILEYSARMRESEELEQRIAELEEAALGQEQGAWRREKVG